MGLGVSLSNALAGLSVAQDSLAVVSRNVSNAGTPGYHAQSLNVRDQYVGTSTHVNTTEVTRAFNEALQTNYNRQTSRSAYSDVVATFLDRLQSYLGKPGDPGALDTVYNAFKAGLQQLTTSPDDFATRSSFMGAAQSLVGALNSLSASIQGMRQDAETQITSDVADLNTALVSLQQINGKLSTLGQDATTRASLMDQRDRLVAKIAGLVDVRADYRPDGTVALSTNAGVGLLDASSRAIVNFSPAGNLSPTGPVGALTLTTASGLSIDLVKSRALQGGEITGLLDLRDRVLVDAQSQLDEIAAGLAQAFSTNRTEAAPASGAGGATGFSLDLDDAAHSGAHAIRDGNDFVLDYTQNGTPRRVKVVRVDDTSKLPLDYFDPDGQRVIGLDFSGGAAAVASRLQALLGPGLKFSASGSTLTLLDDGSAGLTDITGLVAETTSTATQGAGLGLSLFVDADGIPFTNSLSGMPQKAGFARRLMLNPDVVANNALLVAATPGGTLGDSARPDQFAANLANMRFSAAQQSTNARPAGGLNGTVSDLVAQTLNYQGNTIANALDDKSTQHVAMTTLTQRMDKAYGVNIDEEMGQLVQLQNAYAANARVMTVIRQLITALMQVG